MASLLRETDLYPPLAAFLEKRGYTIHAEVQGVDIAARKGDELLLVEMKLSFNLDVVLQAVKRQGAADKMYTAVPITGWRRYPPRWVSIKELLGRLGIGVFFVRFSSSRPPRVEEVLPADNERFRGRLKNKKAVRRGLVREMEGRPGNFNAGGSTRKKIVTAYLVNCLRVAILLREGGKNSAGLSPKALKQRGAPDTCASILQRNYQRWFVRLKRGVYGLSPAGRTALKDYAGLIKTLKKTGG
jgi:hypothetical protein